MKLHKHSNQLGTNRPTLLHRTTYSPDRGSINKMNILRHLYSITYCIYYLFNPTLRKSPLLSKRSPTFCTYCTTNFARQFSKVYKSISATPREKNTASPPDKQYAYFCGVSKRLTTLASTEPGKPRWHIYDGGKNHKLPRQTCGIS